MLRRLPAQSLLSLGSAVAWGLIELVALYRARRPDGRRRVTAPAAASLRKGSPQ